MDRRGFFKIAGGAALAAEPLLSVKMAEAGTWVKAGTIHSPGTVKTPKDHGRIVNTIAAGGNSSLLVRSDGLIFSSGQNNHNQLGTGTGVNSSLFMMSYGLSNAISVAIANAYSLALDSGGNLWGCGYGGQGSFGTGGYPSFATFTKTANSNVRSISCGYNTSRIVNGAGAGFATGGSAGVCGTGGTGGVISFTPPLYLPLMRNFSTEPHLSLGLDLHGNVWSIGWSYGALSNFPINGVVYSSFTQCLGISNAIAVATTGIFTSLALRADGLVFASGDASNIGSGSYGQAGLGALPSGISTFAQCPGISNVVSIACGGAHSLALRSDGLLFATGLNSSGQLGFGNTTNVSSFTQCLGLSNIVAIAAGSAHSLALRSDGLLFACGYNNCGQLGNGNAVNQSSFVQCVGF